MSAMDGLRRFFSGNLKYFILFFLISCALHFRVFLDAVLIAPPNDALFQNYPVRHFYSQVIKGFQFPLWNPYAFAGMPFLGEIQNGALYPLNLIFYFLLSPACAYNLNYILHFALGGFFTFIYMRLMAVKPLPAFLAGMVFGFTGFLGTHANHTPIENTAVYFPLVMYFYERLKRTPELKYALLIALTIAVQVFAGNFQIALYTHLVVLAFLIFYGFGMEKQQRMKFIILGVSGLLLGFIISLPQLASTLELSSMSFMRVKKEFMGYQYFSGFHFYLTSLPSLIFPGFFGSWGPNDNIIPWISPAVVVFALIAVLRYARSDRHVMFWGLVAVVAFLLALGKDTPLNKILYHVPVYNQFRAVGRHLMEFSFAVSVLFAIGMEHMFSDKQKARGYLNAFIIVVSAIIAISVASVYLLPMFSLEPIIGYLSQKGFINPSFLKDALDMRNPALYIPMVFLFLFVFWCFLYKRFQLPPLKYIFAFVLLFEIINTGFKGYMFDKLDLPKLSSVDNLCASESYGGYVSRDTDKYYRIANIFPQGEICSEFYNPMANLTCEASLIATYEQLASDDYSRLLDLGLSGYYSLSWHHLVKNNIILSMLGSKYITISKAMKINPDGIGFREESDGVGLSDLTPPDWKTGFGAARDKEGFFMLKSDGKTSAELLYNGYLDEGAYIFSLKVRADEKQNQFAAIYLYESPSYTSQEALFIHPDYIAKSYKEFSQVVHLSNGKKGYIVRVMTDSALPVYVKDISIKRIGNYLPPRLHEKGADSPYLKLSETPNHTVYLNRNYLPRAWSVPELVLVEDFIEVKKKLDTLGVNPGRQAMLYENDFNAIGRSRFTEGEVTIDTYGLNSVVINASFPDEGFFVLADQYYPGWKAFIDNRETRIYKVNGIFRGVVVPQGKHSVVFKYRPYKILFLMAFSIFLVAGIVVYLLKGIRLNYEN